MLNFLYNNEAVPYRNTISTVLLDKTLQTITFYFFAFFLGNSYFIVLESLQNPVLGDNFGLSIKYNSYVFLGTVVLIFIATLSV